MQQSSIACGSVFGIPLRVHVFLPLVVVFEVLHQLNRSWAAVAWAALLYGPVLWLTVLIHELGHCLATRQVGGNVHSILLWPLGGLAFVGHSSSAKADLLVALAGPLTHIPQFLFWYLLSVPAALLAYGHWTLSLHAPAPEEHLALAVLAGAAQINIFLMAFNLFLPAYPLDGGRVLADTLLMAGLSDVVTAKITAGAAVVIAVGIIFWGLAPPTQLLTVAVGAWMLHSTWSLILALRNDTVSDHPLFCYAPVEHEGLATHLTHGQPTSTV